MIYKFQNKGQIPVPDGYVKNPIPVLHWKKPPSVQLVITRLMKIEQEKGQRMMTRRPPKNPKLPTAAWKYILPVVCVCVKIFPSCSGMLFANKIIYFLAFISATKKNDTRNT
jgi:hypothetical protein